MKTPAERQTARRERLKKEGKYEAYKKQQAEYKKIKNKIKKEAIREAEKINAIFHPVNKVMMKTSAERQTARRERLKKEGKYELYKKQQSEYKKMRRKIKKETMSEEEKIDARRYERTRQREYRAKKKAAAVGEACDMDQSTTQHTTDKSQKSSKTIKLVVQKLWDNVLPEVLKDSNASENTAVELSNDRYNYGSTSERECENEQVSSAKQVQYKVVFPGTYFEQT